MSILVNKNSRILVQGITGREGSFHAQRCAEYGSTLVAGVTPGKLGEKLREGIDTLPLMHRLVSLRQDVQLGANLHDFRWSEKMLTASIEEAG